MTISRILRYHLNLHYRKTSLKNPKILEQNYLIMSLIFLNCIVRGIELGLNLIYIDEVSFEIENNNFYTWRGNDDIIIDGPKSDNKKRFSSIMAINEDEILHSSIISKNIDSNDFIEFMKNLINNMDENKLNNSLFIFDNAKVHISKMRTNYLKDKNIKIITNVPYCSFFNSIELLFRAFKNIIYKECFSTIKELKKKYEI